MFAFRESHDLDPGPADGGARVEVAFTDASLDLQEGDRIEDVLDELGGLLDVAVARASQVHGDDVVTVDADDHDRVPVADGLVTARRRTALMVRVADCVPVLLADAAAGVVGAAHAGRRGVELDVVTRTVERMRALGAADIQAWIGPHICGGCYEVPEEMRTEVAALVPETYAETTWGTPSLDLGAGVAAQLAAADVAVTVVGGCTLEDERFHSYRRDGQESGRLAGLVWLS
ncbi:laccase [Nocardioides aromaticivorans]|uniref:Purine nucleoside phosphorylase n=1 Tax=Nocardioides aromaticivorans TaxID=200618 RepID=A0ABX7PJK4_9ACTN|nr:peptidoglycan editing factor PgeF [Nocardioides aromaticivorans]QSR26105.1 laccase [Nocardioides aromaticivorans]